MTTSSAIGQKLWNYCNVLRDAAFPMATTLNSSPTSSSSR